MHPPFKNKPNWVKSRGYLHITPKLDILHKYQEILSKVQDEKFVAKHGFYPLIHAVIKERKYKKASPSSNKRGHSHKNKQDKVESSAKLRPLHYATHIDSLILGYYAELILEKYLAELEKYPLVKESVIAYRKIPLESEGAQVDQGKSTIHFAYEAFQEIRRRALSEDCVVLMFDIKSFFSEIDHSKLKKAWCDLLGVQRLNAAHFNVFKATTDFRYILLDELRLPQKTGNRRNGFDEKKLANIRKNFGIEAFFESNDDFRNALQQKKIKVYKHPFIKDKTPVGIPQGLPISAVLANLYLLDFDKKIIDEIVRPYGAYYRRYSDDILIACSYKDAALIENFVIESIKESKVEISENKTERYLFKKISTDQRAEIVGHRLMDDGSLIKKPLTYLGFEFYGEKILIKSANLAKFYRRMIYAVKRKAKRAKKINESDVSNPVIFKARLKRKFTHIKLNKEKSFTKKRLTQNADGYYSYKPIVPSDKKRIHNMNYFSYINRASEFMREPAIKHQLNKHRHIFNAAMLKYLKKD